MKKCVIFDLDGTLTLSKAPLDPEMGDLLSKLLQKTSVAIISGGSFKQFEKQFLYNFQCPVNFLKNLYLFPTSATAGYRYEDGWKVVYVESLSEDEKKEIVEAIKSAVSKVMPDLPKDLHGPQIEDRNSQITFSALGQQAPIELKLKWDPDRTKKEALREAVAILIPKFEVRTGGSTSIDITKPYHDKEYGVRKIAEFLNIPIEDMLFIGDALYPGGNDFPATKTGVDTISVTDPEETKNFIKNILKA